ncbi:glycosyltransferase family 52 [Pontibacter rufus]|uniref:glycosyltransferase family 52 n=1 Tax=Pontibacter rufus TaxID=2791028 RepID=UPI0018AFF650|nr:glycosyltransferase family 52 [Pontibacter sp. 172403-2]
MAGKSNILIVGDYNRKDYLDLFKACRNDFNFYFLEYAFPKEVTSDYYLTYGKAIFWGDFSDAYTLLDEISPKKVIFFYIEAYNHVALNLACKEKDIPTFHMEHGLRADYVPGSDPAIRQPPAPGYGKRFQKLFHFAASLKARIRNRLFLLNSIKKFSPEDAAFVKHFISIRRTHTFAATARKITSPKRQARFHISFSPNIFAVHQHNDILPPDQKVYFTGVPYFDHLAHVKATPTTSRAILLIDQPLAEHGLLKWDKKYKADFVHILTRICRQYNYKLYVKPHPRQDLEIWRQAQQLSLCYMIDDKQLGELTPTIPLVLGFYSTYLMPFASFKHTTLITYENHPAGGFLVSRPFVEAGVAHPIYDLQELHAILPDIAQLHQQQLPNKIKFTEAWMYKFDGKSGERLREILLRNDL